MKRLMLAIFIACLSLGLGPASVASAAQNAPDPDSGNSINCRDSIFLGLPTWYKYLDMEVVNGRCEIAGPFAEQVDDPDTQFDESTLKEIDWTKASGYVGLAVLEVLLRIATIVSLVFVTYGGFRYIISQGEPDNAKSARQTIVNSLIGLVISLLATGIVMFIANVLTD